MRTNAPHQLAWPSSSLQTPVSVRCVGVSEGLGFGPGIPVTIATADALMTDQDFGTDWHKVAFFGPIAEIGAEHLRKGSQVYVEGKLKTRKW
jgi:hypothetical protein